MLVAVVYVNWSACGWSDPRSVGSLIPGLLQFSLRPGILIYCLAGSAAEFVFVF